ncbi:hypothetical protein C8Q76DRAFT_636248, partial [Earliella scabrosa]
MWRAGDLREIAHAHHVEVTARNNAQDVLQKLGEHHCTDSCPTLLIVFTTRAATRSAAQVSRARLHVPSLHPPEHSGTFLRVASESMRNAWIKEWQDTMSTQQFVHMVCAVCARRIRTQDAHRVECHSIDLTLLRNEELPPHVYPRTYDIELYRRAILEPAGMSDRWNLSPLHMCPTCFRELVTKHRMPKLSLANWLYYGHDALPPSVSSAIHESTQFDRLLVSRARGSRISFRFTELRKKEGHLGQRGQEDDPSISQRCIKGNVLVMPQNSTQLHEVLPPSPSVIRDTVCAVFVGRTKPTKESIGMLGPVLVRKSRVKTIATFLCAENPYYTCDSTFHGVSQHNLDAMFGPNSTNQDEGVPCSMEIAYIENSDAVDSVTGDYTGRDIEEEGNPREEILMENVGYTCGEDRPVSYRDMKFRALSHCLNGGRFIQSTAGERFVPDFENPALLTWMFPHLDPWGIGGFHHPNRTVPISMQDQLTYLMSLHDSRFQADPDFAFVYYNILQKKAVCDSVRFHVRASQQRDIVQRLLSVDRTLLDNLTAKYDRDPLYEPCTVEERNLLHLMNNVEAVLRNLPGTSGYKLNMRNEIRSLVYYRGTPAFFITLNPSDVHHPLVRLLAGENVSLEAPETGEQLDKWRRKVTVARNPAACAKFFHTMISNFIDIILRYGRPGGGLFG